MPRLQRHVSNGLSEGLSDSESWDLDVRASCGSLGGASGFGSRVSRLRV